MSVGTAPPRPAGLTVGALTGRGARPHAHERVLPQRQLVGIRSEIIEQPVDQGRFEVAAEHLRRPDDGGPALLAGQPRRQVLTVVDGLRQSVEQRAVAEKAKRMVRTT
jgi:hypothetical protein